MCNTAAVVGDEINGTIFIFGTSLNIWIALNFTLISQNKCCFQKENNKQDTKKQVLKHNELIEVLSVVLRKFEVFMVATLCRGDWFAALGYSKMMGPADQRHSVTHQRI
jgi:hypothetical protein